MSTKSVLALAALSVLATANADAVQPAKFKEKILHEFQFYGTSGDGNVPFAAPIEANGIMYGTTTLGGTYNGGAVYSFDLKTGKEKVLYSFCMHLGCPDGDTPIGPLLDVNGTLYGTTAYGGTGNGGEGNGVIFAIDLATGAETTAYTFTGGTDGGSSRAGLINLNGTLYGTTAWGGASDVGTVFSLDPATSAEATVYSFAGGTDGTEPLAGLIAVKGKLYGTTSAGGGTACSGVGCGTVFELDPKTGKEKVLHSFAGGVGDGADPGFAGVTYANGILYGTTAAGGNGGEACYANQSSGCGTVFSVEPKAGAEKLLYSFGADAADSGSPAGNGVIAMKGALYGTTLDGGSANCQFGCGTAYSLDPTTGTATVLYSFQGGTDGSYPHGGLTLLGGKLYGTTSGQGLGTQDDQTLYELKKK